jgi:hypothetical protein
MESWRRRRRLLQVVTDTFPCGLQMKKHGYRKTVACMFCQKAREECGGSWNGELPKETIGHIQSAGCLGQKEVVTAAHNGCIRELLQEVNAHGKADRHMILLTIETESRLGTLHVVISRIARGKRNSSLSSGAVQETAGGSPSGRSSQRVEGIPDSVCRWDVRIHSCGIIQQKHESLGVLESKWDPIRKKLVRRLLEEQDKVLRSYFAQKGGTRSKGEDRSNCKGREHIQWDIYA